MFLQAQDNSLFSLLPARRAPWKEFLFSFGAQGMAIASVIVAGMLPAVFTGLLVFVH